MGGSHYKSPFKFTKVNLDLDSRRVNLEDADPNAQALCPSQLALARQEGQDDDPAEAENLLLRDDWMNLADMRPEIEHVEMNAPAVNNDHDWQASRQTYSARELADMQGWLEKHKRTSPDVDRPLPPVNREHLNDGQRRVYDLLQAGTGKSHTVYALSNLLADRVKRCAFTAKAAYLIHGSTLHSTFKLRPNKPFTKLKDNALKQLKETFKYVTTIIIDEYSMRSQELIGCIDARLRQAKNAQDVLFGEVSILLVGDPAQLLPVGGSPLYSDNPKKPISTAGRDAYVAFKNVVKLDQVMRQQNWTATRCSRNTL
ncbi:hypothetical protein O9G_005712 [Rozella allomycis CSF55]|uniref:ATP-dependent DNA helicase n=1 Tax=Rozella allomycis (strain CSF55) TaxID=988480 RepID=A0A075B1U8_ROZAC|nr:hypothetical protein O9G_005712 [Rozella allomycis CSF55]|eukprot:EPZ36339.1 hypothetical protein O9G_005712 [Rozella allomycis CSF55]